MTPGPLSVYRFCSAVTDLVTEKVYITDPAPYEFRELDDTIEHTVSDGDTWQTIAALYYSGIQWIGSGAQLWRVIAEFQPTPPMDCTIPPPRGFVVYVPSERTLLEEVFSEARRPDYEA